MENKIYAYWLCSVPGVGNQTIAKLKNVLGSAEQIYHAAEEEWAQVLKPVQLEEMKRHKKEWNLSEEYNKMVNQGIKFLLKEDEDYPRRLKNIPDAPYGLFLKGHLPAEDKLSVAIIGARDCSEYGRYVAEALGKYMGEKDVQVISGMARGIDGISQEAALRAGGVSFAVLGSGVDVCYPAQNRALYEQIQNRGGILSIYPPGAPPRPQNFPPRNRIVSGLADVVVVIEARQQSGTLITVDMALEQGKEVYVVPGRITDRLSDGCNKLLKQGAGVVLSPEDFFEEIRELWQKQKQPVEKDNVERGEQENLQYAGKKEEKAKRMQKAEAVQGQETQKKTGDVLAAKGIPSELQPVYDALDFYPQSIEQLLSRLPKHYNIAALNTALMRLCLENHARQVSPGHFCHDRQKEQK